MSLLELGGNKFTIPVGELVLGSDAGCAIPLSGAGVLPRHAVLQGQADGQVIIRKATPAADVLINGVRLGAEPTPLLHGDKVEVGDHELTFVNEEQVQGQHILARTDVIRIGDEQFRFYAEAAPLTASSPPPAATGVSPEQLKHTMHGMDAAAPARPSGVAFASFLVRSGGLMGRRLPVKTPVVNLGRADYNDIVLPDPSISTSHAKLQRREGVWMLVDLDSTNGTFVEGERVRGEAPLGPGAMVRLGDVQLQFEPADEKQSVLKGGGTQVLRTPHSSAPPGPPASAA